MLLTYVCSIFLYHKMELKIADDFITRRDNYSVFIHFTLMYILIWLWLILLIIAIVLGILCVVLYNTLVHLRTSCLQAIDDLSVSTDSQVAAYQQIVDDLDTKAYDTEKLSRVLAKRPKAATPEKKQPLIESLALWLLDHQHQFPDLSASQQKLTKKILSWDHEQGPTKRFFNETVKEYNERLTTFPTNTIWSLMGMVAYKPFTLHAEDSKGMSSETKYL